LPLTINIVTFTPAAGDRGIPCFHYYATAATRAAEPGEARPGGRGQETDTETERQRERQGDRRAVSVAIMSCISLRRGCAVTPTSRVVVEVDVVGANSIETRPAARPVPLPVRPSVRPSARRNCRTNGNRCSRCYVMAESTTHRTKRKPLCLNYIG